MDGKYILFWDIVKVNTTLIKKIATTNSMSQRWGSKENETANM